MSDPIEERCAAWLYGYSGDSVFTEEAESLAAFVQQEIARAQAPQDLEAIASELSLATFVVTSSDGYGIYPDKAKLLAVLRKHFGLAQPPSGGEK